MFFNRFSKYNSRLTVFLNLTAFLVDVSFSHWRNVDVPSRGQDQFGAGHRHRCHLCLRGTQQKPIHRSRGDSKVPGKHKDLHESKCYDAVYITWHRDALALQEMKACKM